ncbi:MAG: DUF4249 domain-containing protein [Muribaculaceae bacterium]|nr:DUF4249 domain-containing protein [Muribaculaceae bacterium]
MAILKKTYFLPLLMAMAMGMTSCYSEFDPKIDSTPVLCMNSTITPGEPVTLFLTRTWSWTEGYEQDLDLNVRDAEVLLIVNGEYKETLKQTVIHNPDYPYDPYPEKRECYQSEYHPKSGDVIRLEATSAQYGEATADVEVPYPVPIDRIEVRDIHCKTYGDISGFPAVRDRCEFALDFNVLAYFTDPNGPSNYYELKSGTSGYRNYDGEAEAEFIDYPWIDYSGEPLLTEHVSELDSTIADTSGYTIFSDRQINGRTYPLRIGFRQSVFLYQNPLNLPGPKETGITVVLRHLDSTYYKHVMSVWEGNDGIVGALGGIGLASAVYPYSNVSTRAGVVVAFAEASLTIPVLDVIALAEEGNFK